MKNVSIAVFAILIATGARGQTTLVAWEVAGQTNFGTDGLAASVVATGITNSLGLTRGSGVTTSGTAAVNAWGGNGWDYATAADALAADVYATFGFTVNTSYSTSLTAISLNYRRSPTGPPNAQWDYNLNGGSWAIIGDFADQFAYTGDKGSAITPVDLSGLTDLQDLPAGTVVSFRITPYGASGSLGNWYVYGPVAGYDLTVTGTLVDAPLYAAMKEITAIVKSGSIHLTFSTASEVDLAGFNILRSTSPNGPFEIISSYVSNTSLKASGTATDGGSYTFADSKVMSGRTYFYKIHAVDKSGATERISEVLAVKVAAPEGFALYQNFPNPFNPTTAIGYHLSVASRVTLRVYDILGREVALLVNGRQSSGFHNATFEGARHASGMYFYRIDALGDDGRAFTSVKSLMLVR